MKRLGYVVPNAVRSQQRRSRQAATAKMPDHRRNTAGVGKPSVSSKNDPIQSKLIPHPRDHDLPLGVPCWPPVGQLLTLLGQLGLQHFQRITGHDKRAQADD